MSLRSFQLDKSKYNDSVPSGPVLSQDEIDLLFRNVDALENEVYLDRALLEKTVVSPFFNRESVRLLRLQLQLAHAYAHAYKMATIRALSLSKEQSDLFEVDTNLGSWKRADKMIRDLDFMISKSPV